MRSTVVGFATLALAVGVPTLGNVATPAAATPPGSAATSSLSIRVSGSHLVNGRGARVQLRGVNRSGAEYACIQGWGIFDGPHDLPSVRAIAAWHVNAVRVPLNEDCWLGINGVKAAYGGANYRNAVRGFVSLLNGRGIYVI